MSGVEIDSLERDADKGAKVRNLSTSWIGQKGVCEIENSIMVDKFKNQLEDLKNELNSLAKEYTKAFMSTNLMDSDNPQVVKAVKLCSSHYSASGKGVKSLPSFAAVWNDENGELKSKHGDRKEHAKRVIGTDLVGTIIEENHEPPDVSFYTSK